MGVSVWANGSELSPLHRLRLGDHRCQLRPVRQNRHPHTMVRQFLPGPHRTRQHARRNRGCIRGAGKHTEGQEHDRPKYSTGLLELKRAEAGLARLQRYEEAEKGKKQAREEEAKQTALQMQEWEHKQSQVLRNLEMQHS